MIFVYQCSGEPASTQFDGHLITVPSDELFEVPSIPGTDVNNNGKFEYETHEKKVAEHLVRHLWPNGLVVVPMTKTKGGVSSDIEAAKKAARDAMDLAQDGMLNRYLQEQQNRALQSPPAAPLPPSRPILKILEMRGLDLEKDFNIKVPGFNKADYRSNSSEMEEMRRKNAELEAKLDKLLGIANQKGK